MKNKKELNTILKKAGKFVIYAALINQLGKPLMISLVGTGLSYLTLGKKEAVNEIENSSLLDMHNLSALEYLNLASYLTNKYKENSDVCRNISNSTFDLFKEFVKRDNKKDLENKIRLCLGGDSKIGHMWIEYKEGNKWIPYETTDFIGNEILIENLKKYSEKNKHSKLNLNHKDAETIPGTKIFYPTLGSLKGVGLIGLVVGGIKQTF